MWLVAVREAGDAQGRVHRDPAVRMNGNGGSERAKNDGGDHFIFEMTKF